MRRKTLPPANTSRKLHSDEALLWQQVKRTVKPLQKVKRKSGELHEEPTQGKILPVAIVTKKHFPKQVTQMPSYSPHASQSRSLANIRSKITPPVEIDDVTLKKLKKGRLVIDDRIDLHGMTQSRAHAVLFSFIQNAFHGSNSIVLVITGKGKFDEGVLRVQVPKWLHEPKFNSYVSGFRQSDVKHGGSGALYVRIRKNRGPSP